MTTTTLKKELHKAIDTTNDASLLEAVYTILNKASNLKEYELTGEQLQLVEERRKLYKQGKLKVVSMEEIKQVCASGYTLPPKSTYFYPKVICGFLFSSIQPDEFKAPTYSGF